jgi:hypothetical protein
VLVEVLKDHRRKKHLNDKQFLIWLRNRMIAVYGEPYAVDFMHKLQGIIDATPKSQDSKWGNVPFKTGLKLEKEFKNNPKLGTKTVKDW